MSGQICSQRIGAMARIVPVQGFRQQNHPMPEPGQGVREPCQAQRADVTLVRMAMVDEDNSERFHRHNSHHCRNLGHAAHAFNEMPAPQLSDHRLPNSPRQMVFAAL